ncbi:OmpA family protein [Frankia sp. AgB1.9]|uniref:OmpA family protein n=1 Tax=unclassified Frankia TaxID=2632575 RepID=UPI001931B541|nr:MULTISPECIES: OmpA family protein [unclassified Frankia]MBL7491795.1 OmpA family protein [Frankia sp. AgW1.1]MBL7550690.1 OmpA family protein [Frankia sp. AgB1.9]MBL7621651.1 OmpA family protein [Frankia sp. AgB1.8]
MVLSAVTQLKRPRPVAFAVSLLLTWLVLALLAVGLRRGPIEKDLAHRANEAVRQSGVAQVVVTVAGTAATLHGDFASVAAADAALRAARVNGVSSARLGSDALVATRPAQPVVLTVERGRLTVRATVPDRARRTALLDAVVDATGGQLTSDIAVDSRAAQPAVPALAGLVTALTRAPGSHTLTLDGGHLVLTGTVANESSRTSLGAAVLTAGRVGGTRIDLDNRLVIAAAPGVPATDAPAAGTGGPQGSGGDGAALAAATSGHPVTFASDSAVLSGPDRDALDLVAAALRAGTAPALVAGHTDSTGPASVNEALSLGRAQAAVGYLVSRGVPAERLRAVGYGASRPAADNATPAGRAANRRVEIVVDAGS